MTEACVPAKISVYIAPKTSPCVPLNTPHVVLVIPAIMIPLPTLSADLAPIVSFAPMANAQWPGSPLRSSTRISKDSWRYVSPPRKVRPLPLCDDCGVKPRVSSDDDCEYCQDCYNKDDGYYAYIPDSPASIAAAKAFADDAMDKMRVYWKTAIVCCECGVIPCESPDDICQECSEQALPCSKCNLNPREDAIEFCQKCFDKERIAKNALNSWFWRNTLKNP